MVRSVVSVNAVGATTNSSASGTAGRCARSTRSDGGARPSGRAACTGCRRGAGDVYAYTFGRPVLRMGSLKHRTAVGHSYGESAGVRVEVWAADCLASGRATTSAGPGQRHHDYRRATAYDQVF